MWLHIIYKVIYKSGSSTLTQRDTYSWARLQLQPKEVPAAFNTGSEDESFAEAEGFSSNSGSFQRAAGSVGTPPSPSTSLSESGFGEASVDKGSVGEVSESESFGPASEDHSV